MDLGAMEGWYDTTKGANESLVKLVDELEKVQPSAVAITKFTSNSGEVTIQGKSFGKPAIAQFIKELKKIPYIENVKTEYINESITDYSADDAFQMTLTLKYDDPKSGSSTQDTTEETSEETVEATDEETVEEAPAEDSVSEETSDETESENETPEGQSEGGVE